MLTITFAPDAQDYITEVDNRRARLHTRRAHAVFSQFTCVDNFGWNTYEFYVPCEFQFNGNALSTVVNYAISKYPREVYAFPLD